LILEVTMAMQQMLAAMRTQSEASEQVRLVPAGRRLVKFAGQRGTDGPLTVGQRHTLDWVRDETAPTRMIEWILDIPEGATLADIEAAFAVLMARHESLRTTYPASGQAIQRVASAGELAIEIYEADGEQADEAALATALSERLHDGEFDLATDLLLRVAVAVTDGIPRVALVVYSHIAADLGSMAVLGLQFTQLAGDPACREVGPLGHQPLDQAAVEHSARGRRTAEAALQSWETQLRTTPQCLYAVPSAESGDRSGPTSGWLWSPAAARALPHIAARTGVSRQAAVLAAICAVLSRRTGQARCSLTALMHNRYRRRLRGYVGILASDTIISVDAGAASFDDLARQAGTTTLRAGKGGLTGGAELRQVVRAVEHDRGTSYARDCVYNDISYVNSESRAAPGDPADAARALGESELRWVELPQRKDLLSLFLCQVEGELVLGALTADPARVPPGDIESLLRGVELLLVAAASGDVDLDQVGEITGVAAVDRDAGWLRIDSCWIELAEAQRLVDDALPAARVFAEPDPAGELRLVAYLAAAKKIQTPEQAHAACMEVLPGGPKPPDQMRYTAMTPGRYVICAGAPADPADLAAWQRQPVIACGDGRSRPVPAGESLRVRLAARAG
jgi:hypothetical protein